MKLFYTFATALLVVLAFIGFSQFFLHGKAYPNREIAPPIKALVVAHGLSMSAWMVLVLVQPALIMSRKHKVHMMLGRIGATLAGLIFILGIAVAIKSTAVTPPEARIWGLAPKPFMAVPFFTVFIFAGFVGLGVWYRRQPKVHRSMMLLATLSVVGAGVSRIDLLSNLYVGTVFERIFGPFFITLIIGLLLLGVRCALTRSLDRAFAIGVIALIILSAGIMWIAPTPLWAQVTDVLVR